MIKINTNGTGEFIKNFYITCKKCRSIDAKLIIKGQPGAGSDGKIIIDCPDCPTIEHAKYDYDGN